MAESLSDEELMAALNVANDPASMSDDELLSALGVERETQSASALPAPVAEGASALNRGVAAIPDFFVDAANTLLEGVNSNPALASAASSLLEPLLGKREDVPAIPRVQDTLEGATDGAFGAKNFMEPGLARTVVQEGGEFIPGAVAGLSQAPKTAAKITQGLADDAATQAAVTAGRLRVGDTRSAGKMIDKFGRQVSDPVGKEALSQGLGKGTVATIKSSSNTTKARMQRMLKLTEDGLNNSRSAIKNRPADEIGNVIGNRVKTISQTNRKAGERLNVIAKGLKGKPIQASRARQSFVDDLAEMDIKFDADGANLTGSTLEDVKGAKELIDVMVRRSDSINDALSAHKLKRFIDTKVDFAKRSDGGLSGDLERALKGLRHNIDDALDTTYSNYKEVNDVFAETKNALNAFEGVAGKKLNLASPNAEKQIGTLSRRLLSNVQSRAQLMDALDLVEEVSKKHGADTSDDLIALVQFGDELDRLFKPAATTSLRSEVAKGAGDVVREGPTRAFLNKAVDSTVGKLSNSSDQEVLDSIRELLKR